MTFQTLSVIPNSASKEQQRHPSINSGNFYLHSLLVLTHISLKKKMPVKIVKVELKSMKLEVLSNAVPMWNCEISLTVRN